MEEKKYKCAVTGEICSYKTYAEGCKPCKECEIGKEFFKKIMYHYMMKYREHKKSSNGKRAGNTNACPFTLLKSDFRALKSADNTLVSLHCLKS